MATRRNSGESFAPNLDWAGSNLGTDDEPQMERLNVDYFGVVQATVSRRRRETPVPTAADWLDVKSAPRFFGLPCMGCERQWQQAWAKYLYGFEGIIKALGAANNITFEIDVTETEEPIQTHPNFPRLRQLYLWNPNTRRFPELMPGSGQAKDTLVKNPMSGVEAYLVPGAIFRMTGVDDTIPSDIWKNVGLADAIPRIPGFTIPETGNRQWFKMGPKLRKRGNCVEWTKEWMLAGPNGINKNVYAKRWIWQYRPQDDSAVNNKLEPGGLDPGSTTADFGDLPSLTEIGPGIDGAPLGG